jgi:NAD(P)-dependent dehydrogenase (short-subunit alcohol dehydrogenase family)
MSTYQGPYQGNEMFKSFTKTWHSGPYPAISPSRPELSAAGKVIFITGGGSGIGKATALAFAAAGAKAIAIFGWRAELLQSAAAEIRLADPTGKTIVVAESVDISQRSTLDAAFARAAAKAGGEGKVDVLVSNAGLLKPPKSMLTYSESNLRESIEANLIGSFNVVQAAGPLLAPDAKILNISSGVVHIAPWEGFWVYTALKAAVMKMFEFLAVENPGLSVFNVQPGVVATELNSVSGYDGQDDGEWPFHYFSHFSLIELDSGSCACVTKADSTTVTLPGQFHLWLASSEAEFLKGRFVWVNWDVDELKAHAEEIKGSALLKIDLNGVAM